MTTSKATAQVLIDQGQALVRSLAIQIARSSGMRVDLDDLVAYGQLGLAEAARSWRSEQGTQFTSFAYYRIRGAIYDGLHKMSGTSRSAYRRLRQSQLAEGVLREVNETPELASDGTVDREVQWFRQITDKLAVVYFSSLSQERGDWEGEQFADPGVPPPVQVASREIGEKLRRMIDTLPPDESRLIRKVYYEGKTLQEAATSLGISKSWASRLHAKTLGHLAAMLRRAGVRDAS